MHLPIRIAVLISGSGRHLRNLLRCCAQGELRASIELVISDRATAGGLEHAKQAGVRSYVVTDSATTFALCRDAGIDLVCLAGYLRLLKIPTYFEGRVSNIH